MLTSKSKYLGQDTVQD